MQHGSCTLLEGIGRLWTVDYSEGGIYQAPHNWRCMLALVVRLHAVRARDLGEMKHVRDAYVVKKGVNTFRQPASRSPR